MLTKISLSKIATYNIKSESAIEYSMSEILPEQTNESDYLGINIEDKINSIDEQIEIKNDLVTTIDNNVSILNNDSASEEDLQKQFEISQENLFLSLGRLGYKKEDINKSILKLESNFSIKDKLMINTESAKEVILKIVEKIYDAVIGVLKKITKWIAIILNDLTLKSIPALRSFALQKQIEDEGMDYLETCIEVYKHIKTDLHTESDDIDDSKTNKAKNTVKKIANGIENFVNKYGYLLNPNDLVKSLQEVYDFYNRRKKFDNFTFKDAKAQLRLLRTDIDKNLIKQIKYEDCAEPLLVYNFNKDTISFVYINNNGRIARAIDVPHNLDLKSMYASLLNNCFSPNTIVKNKEIRSELINLADNIIHNSSKDLKYLQGKVNRYEKELAKLKNNNPDNLTKEELDEINNSLTAFLTAGFKFQLEALKDLNNILRQLGSLVL